MCRRNSAFVAIEINRTKRNEKNRSDRDINFYRPKGTTLYETSLKAKKCIKLICKIKYLKTISNEPTQQKLPLKVSHLNQIHSSTLQRI